MLRFTVKEFHKTILEIHAEQKVATLRNFFSSIKSFFVYFLAENRFFFAHGISKLTKSKRKQSKRFYESMNIGSGKFLLLFDLDNEIL